MAQLVCHPTSTSNRDRAKQLVLKVYKAERVAAWCETKVNTVHQWLKRGTEEAPLPPDQLPKIIAGAKADGLEAPIDLLWPALAEHVADKPADEDWTEGGRFLDAGDQ